MTGSAQQTHYLRLRTAGYPVEMAVDLSGILPGEAPLIDGAVAKGDLEIPSESPGKEIGQKPQFSAAKPPESTAKEITMADGNVAADQLRLFIERVERLSEEKKGIADDIRDVFAEAKGQGYDPATMRQIIKERAMDKDKRDEREALLETYRAALGLLADTPLGSYAISKAA